MSKQKPKAHDSNIPNMTQDGRVIITTSRGHRIECLPIATMLDELQSEYNNKIPQPPTHTITDIADVSVDIPYTEESIKSASEEDRAKWQRYADEKARLETEVSERRVRVIATQGVRVLDMPEDDAWVADHEWMGYTVPASPIQRLYHYVKTEVLGTQEDGIKVTAGIYRASGVDQEVLNQIEESFRDSLGRRNGQDAGTDTQNHGADEPGEAIRLVE